MRVFVSRIIPEQGLQKLQDAGCDLEVWPDPLPPSPEVLRQRVQGCHGILSMLSDRIDREVMDAAGDTLRVISNFAVGTNNIDLKEAEHRGVAVGNTPDVLTDATADLAMALILGAARRLGEAQDFVKAGKWKTWEPVGHIGMDLKGKTLGVFGMGRIGAALARRCAGGWDMDVVYCSRTPKEHIAPTGAKRVDFNTLLSVSDFVSVHAPLTHETHERFNADAFNRMKSTSVFVNTGRGEIHNQSDLLDALQKKHIFSAGLDVTSPEPLSSNDPLLRLPNCIVLPHIGSATVASRTAMAEIAADNLLRGLAREPLRCAVVG